MNQITLGIRPIAGLPCIATLVIDASMHETIIKGVHDVWDLSSITYPWCSLPLPARIARQAMPTTFETVNMIIVGIRPMAGRPCIAKLVIHTCMHETIVKGVHDVWDLSAITCPWCSLHLAVRIARGRYPQLSKPLKIYLCSKP